MRAGALGDLRTRLTLWYTGVLAVLLVALGAASVALLDRGLRDNVDASLRSVADTIAASSRDTVRPGTSLDRLLDALLGFGPGQRFALLDPRGHPDPRLEPRARLPLSTDALRNAESGRETFETIEPPGTPAPVRLLTLPLVIDGRVEQLVQVAASLEGVLGARRRFLAILLGLAPLALAGAAAGGWWLAGRALAPVDRITETARRIGAEDLARRIDAPPSDDEIGRLVAVLNDMLARLETAFTTARQFSADAAHELRTPLTILKGELDVGLTAAAPESEQQRILASCLEEVERLTAVVEDLLFLARADAGVLERLRAPVDLGELLDDLGPGLHALAERAGVALAVEHPGALVVVGHRAQLLRAVLNLADNAIKYTPRGGRVRIVARVQDGAAIVEVGDTGPGIPRAEQARIFERFHRGDPARGRAGIGLGLAIVRSIAAAHGGRVDVESTPGSGSTFRMTLPR